VIRVGIIGAGRWGLNHVRAVASDPSCIVAAVADPDPTAAAKAKQIVPDARVVADPEDIVSDPRIDAIIIATPGASHASLACCGLRANKHVLIEKPLALTLEHALEVRDTARATRKVAMVGHLMLYHPAMVHLHDLLSSGALGELHYLHCTRVNLGRVRHDENALWSFGPHDLSMIDCLLGKMPESVVARGQRVLQQGIEDVVFCHLRYATGETAHLHMSWLNPRKERRLTVVCAKKMVEFDDVATDKLRIYDKGFDRPAVFTQYAQYLTIRDGDVYIPHIEMQEPLQLQLRDFIRSIETGSEPRANLDSGVRTIAILAAAQRSLTLDGEPMKIAAVLTA